MVSRSLENLSNALEDIGKQLERTDLESMIQMEALDLSDIESVWNFTQKMKQSEEKLDGIINNGGALPTYQVLKKYKDEQIEETIAVHLISPFIICHELHPLV